MSAAVKILPHYTYSDYLHWEGSWEIIEGIPHAMSPMPVPKHQRIAVNLSTEFRNTLKECKKCKVYQPIDYLIADDTVLQPDLLIVCGEIVKNFLDFPPALVVEILSPSTALKDRHSKYSLYEKQEIKYYIIVDPSTDEVEVYALENKLYKLQQKGKSFSFDFDFENCLAKVDFEEIW
ncbi:MAG: Uma2 family endonuclease [Chitinophagaceae bacterium]